jgi:hypothetical protein
VLKPLVVSLVVFEPPGQSWEVTVALVAIVEKRPVVAVVCDSVEEFWSILW